MCLGKCHYEKKLSIHFVFFSDKILCAVPILETICTLETVFVAVRVFKFAEYIRTLKTCDKSDRLAQI
jgi:hypothetical protein